MTQTSRQTNQHAARPRRETQTLRTFTGCLRSVNVTPDGHAACVIDTSAGRLRALSDAASIHLPLLRAGENLQVVLLRIRRETPHGCWDWQLLACQSGDPTGGPLAAEPVALMHGGRQ